MKSFLVADSMLIMATIEKENQEREIQDCDLIGLFQTSVLNMCSGINYLASNVQFIQNLSHGFKGSDTCGH